VFDAETYNFPVVFNLVYGSNNVATLYDDTLGSSFFTGYFSVLQHSGIVTQDFYAAASGLNGKGNYDNQAVGYQTINVIASNSKSDIGFLSASPVASDAIFGQGGSLNMLDGLGNALNMSDLDSTDSITAFAAAGQSDTVSKRSIDYALSLQGNWINQ
jgi:hypothetical protein